MLQCVHCESLIPLYYEKCPVCGCRLIKAKTIKITPPRRGIKHIDEKIKKREAVFVLPGEISFDDVFGG